MPANKLLLYPADPDFIPLDATALCSHLQGIGLAGTAFEHRGDIRYLAGDRFLQLITFLGCSPAIEFIPPQDTAERDTATDSGAFCHIRLSLSASEPVFRANRQLPPPRCPACRKPAADWQESRRNNQWTCRQCGFDGRVYDLDFRRHGGFARTFVEIWGIYPSEAVPVDALLTSLQTFSGCDWKYMYVSD